MKFTWIYIIISFSLISTKSYTQFSVRFENLSKMSSEYIQQFLIDETPEANLQRIKNIPGVGRATLQIDSINKEVVYTIDEVNTLLPIINFGGIKDNTWYRLGLSDYNFRGKGRTLLAFYQNNDGYHTGEFYYRDPFLIDSRWGYSAEVKSWSSQEPLFFDEGQVNYDFRFQSIGLSILRTFSINRQLEMGLSVFTENYEKSTQQVLSDPPGPEQRRENKSLIKLIYSENFLNYDFFLINGYDWRLSLQNVYNFQEQNFFYIAQFQFKKFISQPRFGNFAMRFKFALSTNNYSPFAPFVADSHVNIRGIGNRIDRGTGQAILNVEYRKTVLKSYPFGIQVVAFSDLGSWRNPGGSLDELVSPTTFRHFIGGGIRIIYQHIFGAIVRIDYGVDLYNQEQRGFVLGLGQYF